MVLSGGASGIWDRYTMRARRIRSTAPASASVSPVINRNKVVLPVPLRPINAMRSPSSMRKFTFVSSGPLEKPLLIFSRRTRLMILRYSPVLPAGHPVEERRAHRLNGNRRVFGIACPGCRNRLFPVCAKAGLARNPRKITPPRQKMEQHPAHLKALNGTFSPESRRWLSRIFLRTWCSGPGTAKQTP